MRSSFVLTAVVLATAGPSFAAPAPAVPMTARSSDSTTPVDNDSSEALKLPSLGTLTHIATPSVPFIGNLIDHFKINPKQARELEELFARQLSADEDESDALKLPKIPKLGTIGTIFNIGAPIVSGIIDHFKNKDPKQARELEELFARQLAADGEESDALKLPNLSTVGKIFSFGAPIVSGIIDHFKNKDPKQAREFEGLFARQLAAYDDESDALKLPKLSTLGNIFSFAAPVVGGIIDHFKNKDPKQAREFEELFARQLAAYDDESDALKLPKLSTLGNIFSFAAPVVGGIIDHFKNKDPKQARELEELFARQLAGDDDSGAFKVSLDQVKDVAKIGGGLVSIVHSIFSGHKQQPQQQPQQSRDLLELLERRGAGVDFLNRVHGFPGIPHFFPPFKGIQQSREFDEQVARAMPELHVGLNYVIDAIRNGHNPALATIISRSLNELD